MELGLKGKVVFIAGSSRGIGLAIAKAFSDEGAKVVLTGRDKETLAKAKFGALSIACDLTVEKDIKRAVDETVKKFGGIDILVANVGKGSMKGGYDLTSDDWDSALHMNLTGSMMLAGAFAPHIRAQGSIIFISSIAGFEGMGAPMSYSAAKAALLSAMKSLSQQLGPTIRVNAVAPGNILFPGGNWEKNLKERKEHFENYIKKEVVLQRFGRPEEIADAVLFISSSRASFMTGACVVVDGGQTKSW